MKKYPTIQVVLDVHRDAIIDSKGISYAKRTKINGESVAQVMLVVGTNDMGLTHPKWKDHLALAVQMQKKMLAIDKSFPRPICPSGGGAVYILCEEMKKRSMADKAMLRFLWNIRLLPAACAGSG